MDKNLKETIRAAKKLHGKGLIYLNDNIELWAEPNYQILALLIEDINIFMDKNLYEDIKDDMESLIYEMALLTFKEEDLISDNDIEFKEYLIKEYVDMEDPFLIGDEYFFDAKINKLGEIYDKALEQIAEGKFKNMIFL